MNGMACLRRVAAPLAALLLLTACERLGWPERGPDPALLQALERGLNLGDWFTHRAAHAAPSAFTRVEHEDLAFIRALGFGHVRIPVDPAWLRASGARGESELSEALASARAAGLAVVLVLDPASEEKRALFEDPEARQRFAEDWARLAAGLRDWPRSAVAFELLNEPEHGDAAAVHRLMTELVQTLRGVVPRHTLIVSPGGYADITDLLAFTPVAGANLLHTFHFYEPKNFTHQGAHWGWPMWQAFSGFPYPASPEAVAERLEQVTGEVRPHLEHYGEQRWNRERLAAEIDRAARWAERHGVRLWCGEFGVYRPHVDPTDRAAWLRDVATLLHAHGIGWAHWDYAGLFGIVRGPPHDRRLDEAAAQGLGLPAVPRERP